MGISKQLLADLVDNSDEQRIAQTVGEIGTAIIQARQRQQEKQLFEIKLAQLRREQEKQQEVDAILRSSKKGGTFDPELATARLAESNNLEQAALTSQLIKKPEKEEEDLGDARESIALAEFDSKFIDLNTKQRKKVLDILQLQKEREVSAAERFKAGQLDESLLKEQQGKIINIQSAKALIQDGLSIIEEDPTSVGFTGKGREFVGALAGQASGVAEALLGKGSTSESLRSFQKKLGPGNVARLNNVIQPLIGQLKPLLSNRSRLSNEDRNDVRDAVQALNTITSAEQAKIALMSAFRVINRFEKQSRSLLQTGELPPVTTFTSRRADLKDRIITLGDIHAEVKNCKETLGADDPLCTIDTVKKILELE